ncbi:hypothetical protein JW948_06235 [bacterium]|nr:hypothetical protein [bacterium]
MESNAVLPKIMKIHRIQRFRTLLPALILVLGHLNAEPDRWVSINTVNARPLALGGAFLAMGDDWASIQWNPAGFSCMPMHDSRYFTLRLNPLGIAVMTNGLSGVDSDLAPVALLMPGLAYRRERLCVGLLLGEENITDQRRLARSNILDGTRYEWSRDATISFRLAFSSRVSIGAAVQALIRHPDDGGTRWGYRYGLLVEPKSYLHVGLCYFNFDNRFANQRSTLESIHDETLNIGIAFSPWEALKFLIDIRNVSDENRMGTREPHFGMEINPFRIIAVRAGYFQTREAKRSAYSAGLGLLKDIELNGSWLSRMRLGVDATAIVQEQVSGNITWGFLSMYIQI